MNRRQIDLTEFVTNVYNTDYSSVGPNTKHFLCHNIQHIMQQIFFIRLFCVSIQTTSVHAMYTYLHT